MRIDVSRDELELIIDGLKVFETRLRKLGTRKSSLVANSCKTLAAQIEHGDRSVR